MDLEEIPDDFMTEDTHEFVSGSDSGSVARRDRSFGLLTRRVFQSPIVKWLFPVRMRDPKKHDLVLVGENFVELREWNPEAGQLRKVGAKADFGNRIRYAEVLGHRIYSGDLDHHQYGTAISSSNIGHFVPQILVVTFCSFDFALFKATDNDDGTVSIEISRRKLPAHKPLQQAGNLIATDPSSRALAISASQSTLILYGLAPDNPLNTATLSETIREELVLRLDMVILKMSFLYPSREDPDNVTLLVLGGKSGKIVAAVYSWNRRSYLRPANIQTHKQTLGKEHGIPFSLIPLKTAGYFMLVEEQKMFLYLVSPTGSLEQTDSANLEVKSIANKADEQLRGVSARKPLWINWARPVRRADWDSEAVYLGREDGLVRYAQMSIKPWASRLKFHMSGDGGNLNCTIDTAFTILDMPQAQWHPRTFEHDNGKQGESRHDGFQNYKLGYPDVLVAPGSLSDGGLYEIGFASTNDEEKVLSRAEMHEPKIRVHFRNWAPFSDVAVAKAWNSPEVAPEAVIEGGHRTLYAVPLNRDRVFAASGREPHGMIAELRFGLKAQCKVPRKFIRAMMDDDPEFDPRFCNGVWALELTDTGMIILFSFPWRSLFAKLDFGTLTISFIDTDLGGRMMCDEPTLAAGKYAVREQQDTALEDGVGSVCDGMIIQVTASQIQLWKVDKNPNLHASLIASIAGAWHNSGSFAAACQRSGPWLLVASQARREGIGSLVSLKRVYQGKAEYELMSVGPPIGFDEELSSITFLELALDDDSRDASKNAYNASKPVDYAAVGTTSGIVHILKIDHQDGLKHIVDHKTSSKPSDVMGSAAIESIAAVPTYTLSNNTFTLFCGSRIGLIHVLSLTLGVSTSVRDVDVVEFGTGSVHVLSNTEKPESAIAWSGSNICEINMERFLFEGPRITNIFYTDASDHSFAHGNVNAMYHLPRAYFKGPLRGSLLCVAGPDILVSDVEHSPQPLPIRRRIPGTPSKIRYSEDLRSLIVVSVLSQTHDNKRYSIPAVGILSTDVDASTVDGVLQEEIDKYRFHRSCFRLRPGERLCDVMEWFVPKAKDVYHFVVLATAVTKKDGSEAGRITFLRPMKTANGETVLEFASEKHESGPVLAICQDSEGSLIYSCGNKIMMRTYNVESKKFEKRVLQSNMASSAVRLTWHGELLFATTQLHSTLIYILKMDDPEEEIFKEITTDTRPRNGISHHVDSEEDWNLMSSVTNGTPTVTGWEEEELGNSAEAELPCQVTQLAKANVRPRWKQRLPSEVSRCNILGIATDGSLFSFSKLEPTASRFLTMVQDMCLQDSRIRPLFPKRSLERPAADPVDGPHRRKDVYVHIDGDILARLVTLPDPCKALGEMLDRDPPNADDVDAEGDDVGGLEAPTERWARFKRLAQDTIGSLAEETELGKHGGDDDDDAIVLQVIRYICRVVELPF